MVAEPGRKAPGSLPHAIGAKIPGRSTRSRSRSSTRSSSVAFWLVIPPFKRSATTRVRTRCARAASGRIRYLHTILVVTEERVGKLKWARSDLVVKASLTVRERIRRERSDPGSRNSWLLIEKIEKLRDNTNKEVISDLVAANWDFAQLLAYFDFEANSPEKTPTLTTRTYRPYISYLAAMAEESLQKCSGEVEREPKFNGVVTPSEDPRHLQARHQGQRAETME